MAGKENYTLSVSFIRSFTKLLNKCSLRSHGTYKSFGNADKSQSAQITKSDDSTDDLHSVTPSEFHKKKKTKLTET